MGNLTKEQLEKRLDEVLAELATERKRSSQLEADMNSVQAELEAERKNSSLLGTDLKSVQTQLDSALSNLAEEKKQVSRLNDLCFKNVEVITDLQSQLNKASAPVDPAREALIRQKVQAGLSRKQAEEVIQAQEAEDARRTAVEDDED